MSQHESRKSRREARRAALRSVAAAPSFQAVKGKPSRRSSSARRALFLASAMALFVAMMIAAPKAAHASIGGVPEIDPSSMAGAMTLLVGGVLVLTDRNRRS